MKRSQICLVILGLWLCLGANSLAQAPPNFRLQLFTYPNANSEDVYSILGTNNLGVVVGYISSTVNESKSFVVDQNGIIGDQIPGKVYLLADLINIPPELTADYPRTLTRAINESCQVVGRLRGDGVPDKPFFADLNNPESFEVLPNPASASWVHGREINDEGDVLIDSRPVDGVNLHNYHIYNPLDPATDPVLLTDPVTTQPLVGIATGFNNLRQVVGLLSSVEGYYRLTPGISLETFSELNIDDINDSGHFCGILDLSPDPDDNVFFRYTDTDPIQLIGGEINSGDCKINSDGDVAMSSRVVQSAPHRASVFHDDHGVLHLDDLVVGEIDDLAYWNAANLGNIDINDRDAETGFGQIFGRASRTTGRGRKEVTEYRIFILTPIAPPAPDPGITVTPTNGLFTTETGDTTEFDVALDTAPTDSVTIGISSSNTNEGTTDQTSLTFTPANWADAQTVIVTGVDDEDVDGDVAYTIVTTADTTTTDTDYNGMDPNDVDVTNLDDEQAPTVTYPSTDTPTPIPDRGMTDSTITINEDFPIANMVVTLNISHQRSSDLDVYLIGPNGMVQLSNFNGNNNVADFNGTSINGSWTLEVYDTKKKKIGDLNSWSITVEF